MDHKTAESRLSEVPGWTLSGTPERISRTFDCPDFKSAQDFAMGTGNLCEAEGHHADITFGWGYCTVVFWTHKINGLHDNDFIMAAKVNRLASEK
jgi:4a-hydroxytetrahydrobiopterin dehydratase